eukprot:CAMPEP_0178757908 /NCGR_PEP_ID=MMETSP0744-20121128/14070_1 /TAXON_ID=913974 /ORGANISM="Nitzschia punctata, Strain CCMP561" /LENGTH=50 /DNA_ID=CAMNT_0020412171 /DNA_START=1 /DNA_END=150 /DNA_ORIENTATION=+
MTLMVKTVLTIPRGEQRLQHDKGYQCLNVEKDGSNTPFISNSKSIMIKCK